MEVSGEGNKSVHIVVIPFPDAQGHINPILQFSKRLAFKGLSVTLLNLLNNNNNVSEPAGSSSGSGSWTIKVENRPRAPYKGTEPESMESHMHRLKTSICFHLTNLITHHQTSNSPVACVVYDSIMPWVLDLATGFGLLGASFFTQSCSVNALFYHLNRGSFKIDRPILVDTCSVSLPGLPLLRVLDLPSFIQNPQQFPVFGNLIGSSSTLSTPWNHK